MSPMIWVFVIVALLVIEIIRMEFLGICGAVGAVAALIVNIKGLPVAIQVVVFFVFSFCMVVGLRPFGMKYINRIKKEGRIQDLVGKDAIVMATIDNSQGVGVVSIQGKHWSARSKRPNAIIKEGTVVTVVAMNKEIAIVDDRKRNRTN